MEGNQLIASSLPAELVDAVRSIREHIHAHPELSFQEHDTAAYVKGLLDQWGVRHTTLGYTDVIALLPGESDRWIALRADLDALPIQEDTGAPYASKNEGVMHACGHDVHTSILLGFIKAVVDGDVKLPRGVKCIFQPGEEKLPGGASLLIKQGVLADPKVEEVHALHVFPELEAGKVGTRPGPYMASCDELYITVKGKGGHGAMPHLCHDPVVAASRIILALQELASRRNDPTNPTVLSIGKVVADGATNVIPDSVHLEGTFRAVDPEWRSQAHDLIRSICQQTAEAGGCEVDVEVRLGYPPLVNDESLAMEVKDTLSHVLGEENVVDLPVRLTGEDFSFYGEHVPANFFRLGVRNEKEGIVHGVHHPKFDIDPSALEIGVRCLLGIATRRG